MYTLTTPVRSRPPVVVLSDASWHPVAGSLFGAGRLAFIVWFPPEGDLGERLLFACTEVADSFFERSYRLREKSQFICFLEVVALAAPYYHAALAADFAGRDVLHFGDNMAANQAAIKGYSPAPDLGTVTCDLHVRWLELRTRTWFGFVKSEANLADDPSRQVTQHLLEWGATQLDFIYPPIRGWGA